MKGLRRAEAVPSQTPSLQPACVIGVTSLRQHLKAVTPKSVVVGSSCGLCISNASTVRSRKKADRKIFGNYS
eukprot:504396-Amphidinium_carterae.1